MGCFILAGKIKKMIDIIIQERSTGNPAIAEMTKAKFLLKGLNLNKYDMTSEDDPVVIKKLLDITNQLNHFKPEAKSNIKSAFSEEDLEENVVADIKYQLNGFGVKVLIYFASAVFDQEKLSFLMQDAFRSAIVFGCSTAGEITSGKMLKNSVVAMAFNSNIFSDAKVEIIDLTDESSGVNAAFDSFENYYNESAFTMDEATYLGIILIDGISMKEEKVMDLIGNRTNVYFVGGSAGDDMKFSKTYVYSGGKAFSGSAALVLLKMNAYAEFGIIKTQSFNVLDQVLIANKVNAESREVIEFNHKPAILAYAEAVGASSIEDAPKYFATNPVGLIVSDNEIFVRSPRECTGKNIKFYCNLLEGMEVRLLESTNIIEDTKNALQSKTAEFGKIEGIINFNCIERTIELEANNQLTQYGEIFSEIPTVGFSTYGEEYIGHINQTATMLVFRYCAFNSDKYKKAYLQGHRHQLHKDYVRINEELIKNNTELQKLLNERNRQLEETTTALIEFNNMLEDEINERTKRENEIRYLSYHDKLTGLYNRRFYEEEIKRIDTKRNIPISIIMGDVNGLKIVNDAFGHEKGDELLLKAALGIKKACRADDIAARWGGDEFVLLLPKTKYEEAKEIINRINKQYLNEKVGRLQVSVAFGWATKQKPNEDIMRVLKKAEDSMYEQKLIGSRTTRTKVIESISNTLFENNKSEELHSKSVGELCEMIGLALGFSEIEASHLKAAGILHDIGKIVIEKKILQKAGKLTEGEWNEVKRHSEIGYRILNTSFNVADLAQGVLSHHERWDGTGYPMGLKGEEIPLSARIIALADSYDAMISERPYRKALSLDEALEQIRSNAGTQFEPEIARVFVEKVLKKHWQ